VPCSAGGGEEEPSGNGDGENRSKEGDEGRRKLRSREKGARQLKDEAWASDRVSPASEKRQGGGRRTGKRQKEYGRGRPVGDTQMAERVSSQGLGAGKEPERKGEPVRRVSEGASVQDLIGRAVKRARGPPPPGGGRERNGQAKKGRSRRNAEKQQQGANVVAHRREVQRGKQPR